jgi:hypothetical protein
VLIFKFDVYISIWGAELFEFVALVELVVLVNTRLLNPAMQSAIPAGTMATPSVQVVNAEVLDSYKNRLRFALVFHSIGKAASTKLKVKLRLVAFDPSSVAVRVVFDKASCDVELIVVYVQVSVETNAAVVFIWHQTALSPAAGAAAAL